jgi:hypothetical protein
MVNHELNVKVGRSQFEWFGLLATNVSHARRRRAGQVACRLRRNLLQKGGGLWFVGASGLLQLSFFSCRA